MRYDLEIKLLILAITLACNVQTQVKSLKFDFPEFVDGVESYLITHNSYIEHNAIQVTPNPSQEPYGARFLFGRALYKQRFWLWSREKNATFDTNFVVNIKNLTDPGGEGLVFVLTKDVPCPPDSYGKWLGMVVDDSDIGYPKAQIVGIEFDTRKSSYKDLDSNHVGLNVNSVYSAVEESLSGRGIEISSGVSIAARVRYDGKNLSLYVSANKDVDPAEDATNLAFSWEINLSKYLPQNVYVGFSASTSNYTQLNSVMWWKFEGLEIGEDRERLWLWITILVVSVVLVGLFFESVTFWRLRSKAGEEIQVASIEAEIDHCAMSPRKFNLRELKKATNSFSPQNKLGQGGFGTVFKGRWGNRDIAVKTVSENSNQGKQEFVSEIATMGNLNHRNLVKLLGWCYEKEFLLVYEFMPNGSLDRYLFSEDKSSDERGSILTWGTRLNIIRGVAQALEYLHNGCERRILHRDVKTSNVMLDSGLNAKLGDFGLARTIQQSEMTHHSTKEIAGTSGYMAPEMFFSGRASTETDVYAFGVLLIEIVSGRRPADFSKEQSSIVNWVWDLHAKGRITEAADPRTRGVSDDDEELRSVLLIGLASCHPNPHERPSMRRVTKVLTSEPNPPDVPTERPLFMWPVRPSCFGDLDQSLVGSQIGSLTELTGR